MLVQLPARPRDLTGGEEPIRNLTASAEDPRDWHRPKGAFPAQLPVHPYGPGHARSIRVIRSIRVNGGLKVRCDELPRVSSVMRI